MTQAVQAVEAGLKGNFLGGDKPSAEDVRLFNELLGASNSHLHRWVKNMASYTDSERKAFPAASKLPKPVVNYSAASAAAGAAPAPVVVAKSAVKAVMPLKEGADAKKLEQLIRMVKLDGLEFGKFTAAAGSLTWECTVEDAKVVSEDIRDVTDGFVNYVKGAAKVEWKSL